MERVAVIGCGGSGKTHLARQLAAVQGDFAATHLDALYYDQDWNPLPQEEFGARQRELVRSRRWVIEGNYASTLPIRLTAADAVVFLDLPAFVCLVGIAQRRWRHRGGQHAEAGVYDRISWGFVRYVLGYRRTMRPRILQMLERHATHARVITLTSRRQARQFVANLAETS